MTFELFMICKLFFFLLKTFKQQEIRLNTDYKFNNDYFFFFVVLLTKKRFARAYLTRKFIHASVFSLLKKCLMTLTS